MYARKLKAINPNERNAMASLDAPSEPEADASSAGSASLGGGGGVYRPSGALR